MPKVHQRLLSALLLSTIGGAAVRAQSNPVDAPVLDVVQVVASMADSPKPGTVASFYPEVARKAGVRASVNLLCRLEADRRFGDCKVLSETPKEQGFGEAALRVAAVARADSKVPLASGTLAVLPVFFDAEAPGPKPDLSAFQSPEKTITWERRPSAEDMARAAPGVSGMVQLNCRVTANGRFTDCLAVREAPFGVGLAAAGLRLRHLFKMKPTLPDGTPVAGGEVRIPMVFVIPR